MYSDGVTIGNTDNHDNPRFNRQLKRSIINAKSIIKSVFGGTDDSAQKAQSAANKASQKFIEEQSKLAREDAQRLFPQAEQKILAGGQAALDVYGQTLPQQTQLIQAGSSAARNAILGTGQGNIGYTPDMSWAQQTLPALRAPGQQWGTAQQYMPAPAQPVNPLNPAAGLTGIAPQQPPQPQQPTGINNLTPEQQAQLNQAMQRITAAGGLGGFY